jgi:tRNA-specific 2-thiouridylase
VKTVVLGFSGGVDSFFSAYLLQKQGYRVIPVFLEMFPNSGYEQAEKVAKVLNLKLLKIDVRKEFQKQVIKYFVDY